jgi:hypothetical protein
MAPLLIAAGLVLSLPGWLNVVLINLPFDFADRDWLLQAIDRTLAALPLPTLGLALLALGIRAAGGDASWSRSMAVVLAFVGLACLASPALTAGPMSGGRGGGGRAGMRAGHGTRSAPTVSPTLNRQPDTTALPSGSASPAPAGGAPAATASPAAPATQRIRYVAEAPPPPSRKRLALLAGCYALGYFWMALTMWRVRVDPYSGA